MSLLTRSSVRYLVAHRWQFGLSIVGVALGVAVVVSVDLANASAQRAFELSRDTVTGRTTHQVVGGAGGVPEDVFRRLRVEVGVRRVAPAIEGYVVFVQPDGSRRPLHLLGIDPFSEAPFRAGLGTGPTQIDLAPFLTRPDAVMMSRRTAGDLGVELGEELVVEIRERSRTLYTGGIIEIDAADAAAADGILVADIATAQTILDIDGALSRIDLIFADDAAGAALRERVRAALPDSVRLVEAEARTETSRQMTRAFRINLTALSLLALVCGVFLVYNTMSFSVVQRRQMIGTMRAIGVTRREVFRLLLAEGALVGALGTALGIAFGILLGRSLVGLVSQTINDLYFVVSVRELAVAPLSVVKGIGLGIGGTLLAALAPAFEATTAPPRAVLLRSQVEARARRRAMPAALTGVALLAGGALLLLVSGQDLVLSFAALFATVLGFALLTPIAVIGAMRVAAAPMTWIFGPLGRISVRGVSASLSRTAVAIAALTIAISVTIGVGVMIDSFRGTVVRWLGDVLVADLYVASPTSGSFLLDQETRSQLEAIPGTAGINTIRATMLPTGDGGRTPLFAVEIDERGEAGMSFAEGDPETALQAFRSGRGVLVTEPYAYRHGVGVGSSIELLTDRGSRTFRVAGVYYNYASQEGLVAIERATYERFWDDREINGFSVFLDRAADGDVVADEIRAVLGDHEVEIRSNRALRQNALDVFDRTFLITGVLRLLVTLVAVIGVLSALMALQLERAREVGVLRALGLTPAEVWRLNGTQSGLMGVVSGALALPVGLSLAAVMIFVINRRSFGWSLDMRVDPLILVNAVVLAVVAALAAGIYPGLRMSRTRPAAALREE